MEKDTKQNFLTKFKQNFNEKKRKIKDSINKDVGEKVYLVLNILVISIFIFVIPILFTTLTLFLETAGGPVSMLVYRIVFYSMWLILFALVLARSFFKEYKKDKEE